MPWRPALTETATARLRTFCRLRRPIPNGIQTKLERTNTVELFPLRLRRRIAVTGCGAFRREAYRPRRGPAWFSPCPADQQKATRINTDLSQISRVCVWASPNRRNRRSCEGDTFPPRELEKADPYSRDLLSFPKYVVHSFLRFARGRND